MTKVCRVCGTDRFCQECSWVEEVIRPPPSVPTATVTRTLGLGRIFIRQGGEGVLGVRVTAVFRARRCELHAWLAHHGADVRRDRDVLLVRIEAGDGVIDDPLGLPATSTFTARTSLPATSIYLTVRNVGEDDLIVHGLLEGVGPC